MTSDRRLSDHGRAPVSLRSERMALLALVVVVVAAIVLVRFGAPALAAGGSPASGCPAPNGDAYSQAVLADDPIAYYRLDETGGQTLCDSSAQANNGTYGGITYGVAVDASHVYWVNNSTDSIGRSNLDGTSPNQSFITGGDGITGLAVNSNHIYWTNNTGNTIGRANLDGTGVNQSFITGATGPSGVAVDSTYIYWANNTGNTIGRATLDGTTSVNQSFITGASGPSGVAVDSRFVYWANSGGTTIGRATLDGTTSVNQSFITGASAPSGVAVDSSHVYWTNDSANTIGRANLDGTSPNQSFITGASAPSGVAVNSSFVYWTNDSANTIGRATLDGTTSVSQSFITGGNGLTYGAAGALPASSDASISTDGTPHLVGQSGADPSGLTGNHDFTLEAWFKYAGTTTPATYMNTWLVGIGGTGGNQQAGILTLYPNHSGQLGWGPSSCFGIDEYSNNNCWDPSKIGINLWDGGWHYLVVTYDHTANQLTGYADGQDLGTQSPGGAFFGVTFNIAASPIMLGNGCSDPSCFWKPLDGQLDEVAVYATALSSTRIAAHYAAALTAGLTVSAVGQGTVTSLPSGIDCGGSATQCTQSFTGAPTVTLTATPSSGSTFAGWSAGGCSGTSTTCMVTMNQDRSVTATFNTPTPTPQHTLSVSVGGTGSGTVSGPSVSCPGTCSAIYAQGSQVTLTATPATGSTFAGWSGGGCSGSAPTCTVTMSSDQSVTATFNTIPPPPQTLGVSLAGTGSGTVSGSGISCPGTCSASYPSASEVTLSAIAASGSTFAGWSGSGCSGTSTCTVNMSSARDVTATFNSIAEFALPKPNVAVTSTKPVQLPSGNQGLSVTTQGACVLSLKEAPTPLASIAVASGRRRHLKREGLIKPFTLTVSSAGQHVLPLIPTRKEIELWRRHHKHHRRAHTAASASDPLDVNCQPVNFTNTGTPSSPVITNSSSASPTPPAGFTTLLGGLDLDGYCRSIGFSHSQLNSAIVAAGALNDWVCVSSSGGQTPINLQAACNFQYPGFNEILVGNSNNGYSGQCWAKGTPTGTSTTTTTKVPPPPPPAPPLGGCWSRSSNVASISVCVSNNQVTSITAAVHESEPNGITCVANASLPHSIPLNPGGFFSFAIFPPQTSIQGGFSFAGQLLANAGTASARIGTCDGVVFNSLTPP